jgi:hypothetical protein
MMFAAMRRGHKPSMANRIAGMLFLLLCSIGVVILGIKSGYVEWVLIGLVWTLVNIIGVAILVFINILRNRPRW